MKDEWEVKKLGEVFTLEYGKPLPKEKRDNTGQYPVYGANGIIAKSDEFYYDKKSIIVGRKGSSGEINLSENKFWPLDVTYYIKYDDKKYHLRFLYNLLLKLNLPQYAKGVKPGINRNDIYQIIVNIPSYHEQKRIVDILDNAFAEIDKAKTIAEQNLKNAKELFESYLNNIFQEKAKNWKRKKWGELCDFVRGPFGGSLKKSMFKKNGYAIYEQKHAIHDHFNQLRYFIDENKFNEMKRFEVKAGDIIMSCSGVTLGKVAVIPVSIPKGIINQALLKLSPKKEIYVHFLKHWMRSKIFQDIIFEHAGGAAIPNVPAAKILKGIIIPVPCIEEQKTIVDKIEELLYKTKKLETIYKKEIENLEELKKSILKKAFKGEL